MAHTAKCDRPRFRPTIVGRTVARLKRQACALGAFAIVALAYLSGTFEGVESGLRDLRFAASDRRASGDIVVVAIDTRSLAEIGTWPWPRSLHASVIEALASAGAHRIALDIDLSSDSSLAGEDDRLEEALLRVGASTVVLPTFRGLLVDEEGDRHPFVNEPLPRFRQHAQLAQVNVIPDRDGRVRWFTLFERWDGTPTPSLALTMATRVPNRTGKYYYDFSINPSTIPIVSFIDVLRGDFAGQSIAGNRVIIGATAPQLGDKLAVPRWGFLPGAMVQSIAAESLSQERAIQRLGAAPILATTLILALLCSRALRRFRSGQAAIVVFATLPLLFGASLAVQEYLAISADIAPFIAAPLLIFFGVLVERSRSQQAAAAKRQRTARRLLQRNVALKHRNEELVHRAAVDPLTGLPNRNVIHDRIDQAIKLAEREDGLFAVCLLDLDGFKQVNDRFGHETGDTLLIELGQRLVASLRASDSVGRLGGDEFVILLPTVKTQEGAVAAAEKMLENISGLRTGFDVGASIGVSMYPDHGTDIPSLLRTADEAMYAAKANGGSQVRVAEYLRDRRPLLQRYDDGQPIAASSPGETSQDRNQLA